MQQARCALSSARIALQSYRVPAVRHLPRVSMSPSQRLHPVSAFPPSSPFSTTSSFRQMGGGTPAFDSSDPRKVIIFTDYTVYKSKGAVGVKAIRPTWGKTGTGTGITVTRPGTLLLEFANARGERDYDWDKKETFALSATECADILDTVEAGRDKSFFHDPNKMSANEGQITKTLKVTPGRDAGYFFSLMVKNQGHQSQFSVPLSGAEVRVVRSIIEFLIPYLLGFNELVLGPPDIPDGTQPRSLDEPPF